MYSLGFDWLKIVSDATCTVLVTGFFFKKKYSLLPYTGFVLVIIRARVFMTCHIVYVYYSTVNSSNFLVYSDKNKWYLLRQ